MKTALLALALLIYHGWKFVRSAPRPKQAGARPALGGSRPKLSFVVPAWNAGADLPAFVQSYRALSYPNRELVLSAGGSDGSYRVALGLAASDVTVLEQRSGEGKQRALRAGYLHATGELIYLTDIDCRPTDDAVANVVGEILQGGATVVTGSSRPLDTQLRRAFVRVQWAIDQSTEPESPAAIHGILGRNAALTRAAVEGSGAFSTDAPSGTDYTLAQEVLRAGHSIRFVPGHPMPTQYPDDLKTYVHKQARWIRNVFVLSRRYGATRDARQSIMTMLLAYGLVASAAMGIVRRAGWSIAALFSLHAILNRLEWQRRAGMRPEPWACTLHFLATQAAALRAGLDVLRGRSTW